MDWGFLQYRARSARSTAELTLRSFWRGRIPGMDEAFGLHCNVYIKRPEDGSTRWSTTSMLLFACIGNSIAVSICSQIRTIVYLQATVRKSYCIMIARRSIVLYRLYRAFARKSSDISPSFPTSSTSPGLIITYSPTQTPALPFLMLIRSSS